MSEIDDEELGREATRAAKSELVKTLMSEEYAGGSWGDLIHDSPDDFQSKEVKRQKCVDDYLRDYDWDNDKDYQRAMRMPDDELTHYGLGGKKGYKEAQREQKRFDFEEDHPILSKFF